MAVSSHLNEICKRVAGEDLGPKLAAALALEFGSILIDTVFAEGVDIEVGTATGTKIGTATTQKLGFFNATPVVQQTVVTDLLDALQALGFVASGAGDTPLNLSGGALSCGAVTVGADSSLADGVDLAVGTSSGTKIGTATSQKLGFYNATPVVQQVVTADLLDALQALGFIASGAGDTPLNLSGGALTAGATSVAALTATSIAGTGDAAITGHMTITDAKNIVLNATTGTQIGTATSQKLGFWNATPVIQPANANQAAIGVATYAAPDAGEVDGTYGAEEAAVIVSLRTQLIALAADVATHKTLTNQLRSDLIAAGIIKGAA